MAVCTVFDFAGQGNIIVEQRLDAGDRRAFLAEKREGNADFAGMRIQQATMSAVSLCSVSKSKASVVFHQGDKARHMRAFLVGRQETVMVRRAMVDCSPSLLLREIGKRRSLMPT